MSTVQTEQTDLVAAEHLYTHEWNIVQADCDTGEAFDWNTSEYGILECLHDVWTFIPEEK